MLGRSGAANSVCSLPHSPSKTGVNTLMVGEGWGIREAMNDNPGVFYIALLLVRFPLPLVVAARSDRVFYVTIFRHLRRP